VGGTGHTRRKYAESCRAVRRSRSRLHHNGTKVVQMVASMVGLGTAVALTGAEVVAEEMSRTWATMLGRTWTRIRAKRSLGIGHNQTSQSESWVVRRCASLASRTSARPLWD
jgi:hypothetical protein